ncbi:hypothetical protein BU16DRAFT_521740 [Lophium mytilinum]|uniref:Uncharacterized protein n=1 Tax=Lophium mytilinum TaxID=390894 RepID=A0A6A6RE52_9PEZI|nr:hypothetical protein BU16DRAFT_521740 [Lophium mytilinum]
MAHQRPKRARSNPISASVPHHYKPASSLSVFSLALSSVVLVAAARSRRPHGVDSLKADTSTVRSPPCDPACQLTRK